jgi:Tfp pilus assembly protein PilV
MNQKSESPQKRLSNTSLSNDRGMSLMEVVIASSVMILGTLAFSQVLLNQRKETLALSQKLALLDFQGLLAKTFTNNAACQFTLADSTLPANPDNPKRFTDPLASADNGDIPAASRPVISLNNLYSSNNPPLLLATTDVASPSSNLGSSLKVKSIDLVITKKLAPHQFLGEIQISTSGGVRSMTPATLSMVLTTTATSGTESIQDCTLKGSNDCQIVSSGWAGGASADCPSGTHLTGGSCDMHRGGDGRIVGPRYCVPSANSMSCSEGNSGTCRAHAVCCS